MKKNKIYYVLILLITFLLCLLFKSHSVRFLLGFEVIIVFFSWFLMFFMRRIHVKLEVPYFRVQKKTRFPIIVQFRNDGRIPVSNVRIRVKCINEFTGQEYVVKETVMLDGKSTAKLEFTFKSDVCGNFKVFIDEIRVYDYFDLFQRKLRQSSEVNEVMILPVCYTLNIQTNEFSKNKHEWETYSKTMRGEDSSEVFDLHLFRQGDTMQKVHWKLSAKTNEYFVKEFSKPIENMMILFLNMDFEEEYSSGKKQQKLDVFLSLVASMSWSMMKQNIGHMVIWYDEEENRLSTWAVENEEQVYEMIEKVSANKISQTHHDVYQMYRADLQEQDMGLSFMIDVEGRFFIQQECVKTFVYDELEKELMEWQLEI